MTSIFLSYARGDDVPFVGKLYGDLTGAGFKVWVDRESLLSRGLTFHQEIKDAIRTEVARVVYVGGGRRRRFLLMYAKNGSLHWNTITSLSHPFSAWAVTRICRGN